MSVLILNKLPAKLTNYKDWLEDYKDDILVLTQNKHKNDYKAQGLPYVEGFDNYITNNSVDKRVIELYKEKRFNTIIALDESDIIRAGYLRSTLKIKGQNLECANLYRNKVDMKDRLHKHIKTPKYMRISDFENDVGKFLSENGFPIVIKPVDGMGGMNTFIINSIPELEKTKKIIDCNNSNHDYMVETYVEGDMYSIDGLLLNDKIEFCSVSRYHNSVLVYKERKSKGHSLELVSPKEQIFTQLKDFTKEVLNKFPNPELLVFHCEVFVNKNNEITFCEIASRLGGARIPELIRQSYGVNLEEIYCRMACNLNVNLPLNNNMIKYSAVYFIPKSNGKLVSVIEKFPFDWVTEYQPYLQIGSESQDAISSSDIFGTVVCVADTEIELKERLKIITEYTKDNIVWQ